MRCSICGTDRSERHRLDRGVFVFCCPDCLSLVRDVRDRYDPDEPEGATLAERRAG